MSIRVALHHLTRYRFDRPVGLSPHEIRLRPAPHCRTPIRSYSLRIRPEPHFINWQQDAYGNYLARLVFPQQSTGLEIAVDLVADLQAINPFDFFIESWAETFPFAYPQRQALELAPYLEKEAPGPLLSQWLEEFRRDMAETGGAGTGMPTVGFLVALNQRLQSRIAYLLRMEPGVQTPEQTLELGKGSCRDSGWLLVQILRHLGLAARFVSGYLIQLRPDEKPLEGPAGPETDFTDLHAWAEVYIPGAGWIGLDPTSGLFAAEGHIPLAATAFPASAAAVSGFTDPCESRLEFRVSVTRVREDPRVTLPYSDEQWRRIDALGRRVDADLAAGRVRLTQGGEPTFVAVDDMEGPEWNTTALSPAKWKRAEDLAWRLQRHFAPGALLMYAQGKWYPGETQPRWALPILWRADGQPLWRDPALISRESVPGAAAAEDAGRMAQALAEKLGLDRSCAMPAYEDPLPALIEEQKLPENVDPLKNDLGDRDERARPVQLMERGLEKPAGWVLPLRAREAGPAGTEWESSPWPLKRGRLFLLASAHPMGMRLPLSSLPELLPEDAEQEHDIDPFSPRGELHAAHDLAEKKRHQRKRPSDGPGPREVVRTALCVEVRERRLFVYLPPLKRLEHFIELVAAIESAASALKLPVRLEGYMPPADPRLRVLAVTPDPGVIEVNIHPSADWPEMVEKITALYGLARQARLGAEKFMLDGRHTGTGGGNHVTLGGATAADSPFLRRPDLLRSLVSYWQNHPALSYLFSGRFIGPTSQAPRVDEARDDALYELEIAFQQMGATVKAGEESAKPWLVDRLLRNLLVDLTGNTHRAEFCIDKLYSPDGPAGRLGLVELRAFEMPPHARMALAQMLLVRALVAWFWKRPYEARLVHWGNQLHDRWMLPHFLAQDLRDIAADLNHAGYALDSAWYAPFLEFRFPRHGTVNYEGIGLELRQALEPWHVLGEEQEARGTARYVDSSVERLQVKVSGMTGPRHVVACNGRALPLQSTGLPGEYVAGVRYRAWHPPSALHPTIGVHSPLVFDVVDTWSGRSMGGATYHVSHPGGRDYDSFPVNAMEAEARRFARFWDHGHTPGPMTVKPERPNPAFPMTLDLRWMAQPVE